MRYDGLAGQRPSDAMAVANHLANLHLGLLGDLQRSVHLDAEIPNCAFEFRVPEQQLNSSEISGPPIDHRGFRTSHRMRPVCRCVQTDRIDPTIREYCRVER